MEKEEFSPAMEYALRELNKLVSHGVEFPDACWKVCQKTGFSVDELRRAYDTRCAED